jgi:glyoxylase I family protein
MPTPSLRVHGVRYQTRDVARAVAFYTQQLGFELKHQQGTAFANVSCGGMDVLLSGPGSSGARPMPDGQEQQPGGWNRLVLAVDDLWSVVAAMKERGAQFRSDIVAGPGGKQIQLLDPDGNPIELFEPAAQR